MGDMDQSAVAALRTGSWRERSGGTVAMLATVAVALDVVTTAHILYSPAYWEGNLLLATLADIDPAVALAVFAGYCSLYLAVAWLSLGWFSTVAGASTLLSMGGGGLNNLVLFTTGTAIYSRIALSHAVLTHVVAPALGVMLGIALARWRGPLPWREVVTFAAIILVATVVQLRL